MDLKQFVKAAMKVAPKKSIIDSLNNMICVDYDRGIVYTTDLEAWACFEIWSDGKSGRHRIMLEELKHKSLEDCKHLPVEDYPESERNILGRYRDCHNIAKKHLVKASSYVSKDVTRGVLCGINVDKNGGICATDGHRLYSSVDGTKYISTTNMIHAKIGQAIKATTTKKSSELLCDVEIYEKGVQVTDKVTGITYYNKCDGSFFPDISKGFPFEYLYEATFDRKDMLQAIKEIKAACNKEIRLLRLDIAENIRVHAFGAETLTLESTVDATGFRGDEPFRIGFDWKFLEQVLKDIETPSVTMRFNRNITAVTFNDGKQLLMPLRIFNK